MNKWCGPPHEPQYMCGAYARTTGKPCRRFARENGRCKLHGGRSTGAITPLTKHGFYTKESILQRKKIIELLAETSYLINKMNN